MSPGQIALRTEAPAQLPQLSHAPSLPAIFPPKADLPCPNDAAVQTAAPVPVVPNLQVKECEREVHVMGPVGGAVAGAVGRPHKWLVIQDTAGNIVYAPGLGNADGVPGANNPLSPDIPGAPTYIRDHSGESPRSCKQFPAVDPYCVISTTPYGLYQGRWVPFWNDCNTFTRNKLDACQFPNSDALRVFRPSRTEWDKPALLPKNDSGSKYKLTDVDRGKPRH